NDLSHQAAYWKEKLNGFETLALPTDFSRPSEQAFTGKVHSFYIPERISNQLRLLSQQEEVTLNSVLLTILSVWLSKYSGQEDIVTGSLYANRAHYQTSDLIGFFVNTLVNRVHLQTGQSFLQLIRDVHTDQVTSRDYQDLPFPQLLETLSVERDPSRHPIFQVMFILQSFGKKDLGKLSDKVKPIDYSDYYQIEKFDLSVFMDDSDPAILVQMSYATSLFSRERIEKMSRQLLLLLERLLSDTSAPYSSHSVLDRADYQYLINDLNATDKVYGEPATLTGLFLAQAESKRDSVALVLSGKEMSYEQLDLHSSVLASKILVDYKANTGSEMTPGTLIGICLDRSFEMIVGILGILKAGGAYVPIDPGYPKERIDFILEDTATQLILTRNAVYEEQLYFLPQDSVLAIDLNADFYPDVKAVTTLSVPQPDDLAYIIYTSGTTGKPKGVMVDHRAICNTLFAIRPMYGEHRQISFFTTFIFDVSIAEVFATLTTGGALHILTDQTRENPDKLADYLLSHEIGLAYLPPAMLSQLPRRDYPALKTIYYAGESCEPSTSAYWSSKLTLYNYYGPTETCVYSTSKLMKPGDHLEIGKPFANIKVYVLDKSMNPVPIGVSGELYIGGTGIARGYLNREKLTAEHFLDNPFEESGKIYKTGDMVRWLE
ncbi:MAG: amino acid adenylation domain-containing protein, partial [Cyclobacteriaceae bacterium]